MRVSTAQVFDNGTLGIQRNQGGLFKLQNQLSTGRRVLSPEDDPVAASQALVTTQAKELNNQFIENQGAARTQLNLVETKLSGVTDELQNILQRAVQAGNGSLSADQRGLIAQELKTRLESITNLANSQDTNGLYLFAGFQAQNPPFQQTGNAAPFNVRPAATTNPYMGYQGDSGQRKLQVSPSQEMAITETGDEIFMRMRDGQGNLTDRSMFDSIKNLVDILDPTSGQAFSNNGYQQALGDVNAAIAHVSRIRTSVGSRLAALDSLDSESQDLKLQYETRVSNLQDLDYAKAISDLSRQQIQLEAAQKSFKETSQLSLFNIL